MGWFNHQLAASQRAIYTKKAFTFLEVRFHKILEESGKELSLLKDWVTYSDSRQCISLEVHKETYTFRGCRFRVSILSYSFGVFVGSKFPRFPKAHLHHPHLSTTFLSRDHPSPSNPEVFVWDAIGGKVFELLKPPGTFASEGSYSGALLQFLQVWSAHGDWEYLGGRVWKGGPRVWKEDGTPRILDGSVVRITLRSPPFICHVRAICKGTSPTYRGLTNITNHGY